MHFPRIKIVIPGSLQTSLSFLQSQPPWRFRSFATMSSMSLFSSFPMTIKKTPAASRTFNCERWSRKRNVTLQNIFLWETKMKKTVLIVSWQFVDSVCQSQPWIQTETDREFGVMKMLWSELMETHSDGEQDISLY